MSEGRVREKTSGPRVADKNCLVTETWYNGAISTISYGSPTSVQMPASMERCCDMTNKKRHGHYVSGGLLDIQKCSYEANPVSAECITGAFGPYRWGWISKGHVYPCFCPGKGANAMTYPASAFDHVLSHGAEAWAKFKPGKPKASASVFLAELRDFPSMLKTQAKHFRDLGGNYLNYQFGWLPFISDLKKMYELSHQIEAHLTKIRNGNGKWLLREGSVFQTNDVTDTWDNLGLATGACFSPLLHSSIVSTATYHAKGSTRLGERIWFSGRFRYYIPETEMQKPAWRRDMIRKLYGLTITPSDVWELTPWSWLSDYFINFGDVFQNISTGYVDAVAKYAYVMGETHLRHEQHCHAQLKDGDAIAGTVAYEATTKCRGAASPFGFGIADPLTGRQIAILTALGISRL